MAKTIPQLPNVSVLSSGAKLPLSQDSVTYYGDIRQLHFLLNNDAGLNRNRLISGNLLISGNESVSGNLNVSGSSFLGRNSSDLLRVIGNISQSGNNFISGNLTVTGDLRASGNISLGINAASVINISGSPNIGGSTNFYGNITVIGSGDISSSLRVSGSGRFGDPASLNQSHIFFGRTTLNSTGIVNDALYVSGNLTGGRDFYIHNDAYINNNFYASGSSRIGNSSSNTLSIYSTQTNYSSAVFISNISVGTTLDLAGNLRTSGINILGNNTSDYTYINGPFISTRSLSASGESLLSGHVYVSGTTNVSGRSIFYSGLSVKGPMVVSGNTTLGALFNESTHVRGTGYVGGDLIITGNVSISGNLLLTRPISGDYVTYAKFNPSVRVGPQRAISYLGQIAGIHMAKFTFPADDRWHESSKRYPNMPNSGFVFITGVWLNDVDSTNSKIAKCFLGIHKVWDLQADHIKFEVSGVPEGHAGVVTVTGTNADQRPMILASWNSGDLVNISGIVPTVHVTSSAAQSSYTPHWRIIFNKQLKSGMYYPSITHQQRSPFEIDDDGAGAATPCISYLDSGYLPTECIISFNRPLLPIKVDNSQDWFTNNSNGTLGIEHKLVPRVVSCKFENY